MESRIDSGRRHALRRLFLVIAVIAPLWALVVTVTGGFVIEAGPVRLSSRGPPK